jgi:hypothetical protein
MLVLSANYAEIRVIEFLRTPVHIYLRAYVSVCVCVCVC